MSVHPTSFNSDGSAELLCDETGHTGSLAIAAIAYDKFPDGSDNTNFITLTCPDNCGMASSSNPVGGGGHPAIVQEMFVRKYKAANSSATQAAIDAVKAQVTAMDGPDRWQVDEAALLTELGP